MLRNFKIAFISLLSLWSLTGCATSYQAFGLRGGYKDIQQDADTWRVRVDGNSLCSREMIEQFTSRRCAEITLENGKRYYEVISQNIDYLDGIFGKMGNPFGKATIKLLNAAGEGQMSRDAFQVIRETDSVAKGKLSEQAAKAIKAMQP